MAEPQAYQWSSDRVVTQGAYAYRTFSVGVYQWLPKASGKGLKRSTTIRVLGYTAEPERVFDRAEELCRRLNEAGARADDPPAWLQKQYSVPRPAGMVVERASDDLTGAQVRALRQRVMNERLLPAGFVKGAGGTYVRRRGEQVHLVDFQAARWGHTFTVNLAFHYTFVPPLFARRPLPLAAFDQLDCALRARIGHFLPENRDTWFDYGSDADALRAVLVRCADESLRVLDAASHDWSDPAVHLAEGAAGRYRAW